MRGIAAASCHRAVHSDAFVIGAMPLAPTVALGGFDAWAVVWADDIRQSSSTQRSGVILVNVPRRKLHGRQRADHLRIISKREARPLLGNLLGGEIWIPGESAEAVQVCHSKWMSQPISIHSNVGNSNKTTCGPMKAAAFDDVLGESDFVTGVQIEVENLLPHGR